MKRKWDEVEKVYKNATNLITKGNRIYEAKKALKKTKLLKELVLPVDHVDNITNEFHLVKAIKWLIEESNDETCLALKDLAIYRELYPSKSC